MKRIEFLKQSVGLLGTVFLGLKQELQPKKEKLIYYEGSIAGYQYYNGPKLESEFRQGEALELRREPKNNFDKKAVAIYYKGEQLGYVKQTDNKTLSLLIDQNQKLSAQIKETKMEAPMWLRVRFEVLG